MKASSARYVATVLASLLCLSVSSIAQRRSQPRADQKSQSQPITIQTGTTKDGRIVLLKSDGTWEFASETATSVQASQPSAASPGTVSVEAALVYRSGDVKPVARTIFYLLDEDLAKILRNAGLKTVGLSASRGDTDYLLLFTYGLAMTYPSNSDYVNFYPLARDAVQSHLKYKATTDFKGQAQFEDVKPGSYFVYGVTETVKGFALWNLPVEVKSGNLKVVLDQNNAVYAS